MFHILHKIFSIALRHTPELSIIAKHLAKSNFRRATTITRMPGRANNHPSAIRQAGHNRIKTMAGQTNSGVLAPPMPSGRVRTKFHK